MKKLFISSAFLVMALFGTVQTFALVQLTQTTSQVPVALITCLRSGKLWNYHGLHRITSRIWD
jgi:hypothetical protein